MNDIARGVFLVARERRPVAFLISSFSARRSANTMALRLGTRGSKLALWQAEWIAGRLHAIGVEAEISIISTSGDNTMRPLSQIGGQGAFVKEIQRALIEERIDLAVHSLKDLPTDQPRELTLAAIPPRESNRDVLLSTRYGSLKDFSSGATIATGSARRASQLRRLRTDLTIVDVRGNVDTRLRKLDSGEFDGLVLAEAGLKRLGLTDRVVEPFDFRDMLPAVGQGALGVEARRGDGELIARLTALDDEETRASIVAERSMLASLGGGCQTSIGAWGRVENKRLLLMGRILSEDGANRIECELDGEILAGEELGRRTAEELRRLGASELLRSE